MSDNSSDRGRHPIDVLAEEYADRVKSGESLSIDQFAAECPAYSAQIKQLFPALFATQGARIDRDATTLLPSDHRGADRSSPVIPQGQSASSAKPTTDNADHLKRVQPQLRQLIERELNQSEIIIWIGRPKRWSGGIRHVLISLGGLLFAVAILWRANQMISYDMPATMVVLYNVVQFIFCLLVGVAPWMIEYQRRKTCYVVTNQRALQIQSALTPRGSASTCSSALNRLNMRTKLRRNGSGDLTFGAMERGFLGLADVRAVESIIRDAMNQVTLHRDEPPTIDVPLDADPGQLSAPLWAALRSKLNDDEQVRWIGKPIAKRFSNPTLGRFFLTILALVVGGLVWSIIVLDASPTMTIVTHTEAEDLWQQAQARKRMLIAAQVTFGAIVFGGLTAWSVFKASRTAYLVSSERIILSRGGLRRDTRSYPLHSIVNLKRDEKSDGSGNITIELSKNETDSVAVIHQIRNVRPVEALLRQLTAG